MLRRLADIRRGERARAGLAFLALLFVVGSYTIVKAVREAVFLSRGSVTELSLIAVGLAVLSGTLLSVYLRVTSGIARDRVVVGSYVVVALTVALFALGLRERDVPRWVPWLFYVWSSVFGVFIVMQFWLLVSHLFDVREAKRSFPIVGVGAVVGGLLGGIAARTLASRAGAVGLLLIAAAMLLAAAALAAALWNLQRGEPSAIAPSKREGEREEWRLWALVKQPSYARLLTIGIVLATVATTLLDWQLKTVAKHAFAGNTEALAAFFGSVYAYLSAGSLALEVLVTSWLFHRYGVGVARGILPVVLLLGFATVLGNAVVPASLLAVLTAARLCEGGVRFAINQPAVELSWLPLPAQEREIGKALADTVGDRVGTGLAGAVWIGLAALALDRPERVHWVGLVGIATGLAWLAVLRRTQAAYVAEMRTALAQRAVDLEGLWRSIGQEQTRQLIVEAIESREASRVAFALYLLEGWEEQLPELGAALSHERTEIRLQALLLLAGKAAPSQRALALPCLKDRDLEVREAAVAYLQRTAPVGPDPLLASLEIADMPAHFARWLIEKGDRPSAEIAEAIAAASRDSRVMMIRLLGTAPAASAAPLLGALLDDTDEHIVEAAIRSIGRARVVSLVPALAAKLSERRWRARVIAALTDLGSPATLELLPRLTDRDTPVEVRRAIVRLAGASRDRALGAELLPLLDDPSNELFREALRALARLRAHSDVAVDAGRIRSLIAAEARALFPDLLFLDRGAWPQARVPRDEEEFLQQSIRDAVGARIDRIFRLLSLIHPPADVFSAYRGIKSSIKATRAKSIEFLDNVLDGDVKRLLLPALEDADAAQLAAILKLTLDLYAEPRERVIERLRAGNDPWLCRVAEWSQASMKENNMALSLVEKAFKLRTVDVLARVSSEELAHIANIAEEIELLPDAPIYGHGDAPDALYVIVSGTVRLHHGDDEIDLLGEGEAFGSWALFDEAPRVASAAAAGPVTVLKVDRDEFLELLGDRVDLTRAIFKAMVERLRSLAELAQQR